jgi:tripartite ATP-independent transporter DctP family solute receptor
MKTISLRTRFVSAVLMFVLVVSMVSGFAAAAQNPIELKLGHCLAVEHPRHVASLKFAELVKERTNGAITVEVYPAETLGTEVEMGEALQLGTLDVCALGGPIFTNWVPEYAVFGLPFMFESYEEAYAALDGPVGDKMIELAKPKGFVILAHWDHGFRQTTNNVRPITVPDDLKGLKIRTPQEFVNIETFKAFGSSVTPMAFGELYLALQQGVVDGQENPLGNIYHSKLYEVQKYLSITNHIYANTILVFGQRTWNSIPDEYKPVIQQAAIEARDLIRQLVMEEDTSLVNALSEAGMQVNYPDLAPFQAMAKDIYKSLEGRIGKQAIDDLTKFLEDYRASK